MRHAACGSAAVQRQQKPGAADSQQPSLSDCAALCGVGVGVGRRRRVGGAPFVGCRSSRFGCSRGWGGSAALHRRRRSSSSSIGRSGSRCMRAIAVVILLIAVLLFRPGEAGVSKYLKHKACSFKHELQPSVTVHLSSKDSGLTCATECETHGAATAVYYAADAKVNQGFCSVSEPLGRTSSLQGWLSTCPSDSLAYACLRVDAVSEDCLRT
jgi:hypothetical protein